MRKVGGLQFEEREEEREKPSRRGALTENTLYSSSCSSLPLPPVLAHGHRSSYAVPNIRAHTNTA